VLDSSFIPKTCVPASRRLEKAIRVFQLCYIFYSDVSLVQDKISMLWFRTGFFLASSVQLFLAKVFRTSWNLFFKLPSPQKSAAPSSNSHPPQPRLQVIEKRIHGVILFIFETMISTEYPPSTARVTKRACENRE
jgi:hypothetical protein